MKRFLLSLVLVTSVALATSPLAAKSPASSTTASTACPATMPRGTVCLTFLEMAEIRQAQEMQSLEVADLRYEVAKERYEPFDEIVDEDAKTRERIAIASLDATIAEKGVFVIANNKAEGSAPLSIVRLAERIAEWDGSASDVPATHAS